MVRTGAAVKRAEGRFSEPEEISVQGSALPREFSKLAMGALVP
jgi:hypothetical protein